MNDQLISKNSNDTHTAIGNIVREPLIHFLLLTIALFLVHTYVNRNDFESDPQFIEVDRDSLLTYLQYRSRAFDADRFSGILNGMTNVERHELIDEYVREEALYREAKALGLGRNDYVARLRLVQQLEFIVRGFAEEQIEATDVDITQYYETHTTDYLVPETVTFTHVFFSSETRSIDEANELAETALKRLNRDAVRFDQAPAKGDRFLYHVNYVRREADEVASHFGNHMQRALFSLELSDTEWYGPFQSSYGFHLVMLTEHTNEYVPALEEIRDKVARDYRQAELNLRFEKSIDEIVDAYDINVAQDVIEEVAHTR